MSFTQEEARIELEWRKCASDVFYFLENYWKISVPMDSISLKLREPQREAIELWETGVNTLSLKARQIGWSTISAAYVFWKVFFHSDLHAVTLSRTEVKAKDLLAMSKYGYNRLPQWLVERGPQPIQNVQLILAFDNGSKIEAMPSKTDAARGTTAALIIADEWAFFADPANAWASISPAADVGGQIIGISTANGLGNWFHKFWLAAEAGQNSFTPLFFPWWAVPERDEAWYQRQILELEPWQLRQEFPATAEEAFIASGNPVYDRDMLMEKVKVTDPLYTGRLGRDPYRSITFIQETSHHSLRVWAMPEPGETYVIGGDVASGAPDGDFSTAVVINARSQAVVAVFRLRCTPEDYAEAIFMLGEWYNWALLGPERNTHGLTVVRLLSWDLDYPNLYFQVREDARQTVTKNPGWQTTQNSKLTMVNDLGGALRRGGLKVYCEEILSELFAFSRKVTAGGNETMGGKPHDDLVIALAIAVQLLRQVSIYDPVSKPAPPSGYTFDFARQLIQNAPDPNAGANTIGYVPPPPGDPLVYV